MLVVLLSLLNNVDLEGIRNIIKATYQIKRDSKPIEILSLKAIPLISINPNVFITATLRTVEDVNLKLLDDMLGTLWDDFLRCKIAKGYFPPDSVL
jgi:hypothetical protein